MNYELALKLKDAGFPQKDNPEQQMLQEEGDPFPPNNRTMWIKYFNPEYVEKMREKIVYIPTLEELIEACGNGFTNLALIKSFPESLGRFWYENHPELKKLEPPFWVCSWTENGVNDSADNWKYQGETPEEAVANLWLALNEK